LKQYDIECVNKTGKEILAQFFYGAKHQRGHSPKGDENTPEKPAGNDPQRITRLAVFQQRRDTLESAPDQIAAQRQQVLLRIIFRTY
jgi:hypothetical protein